LDADTAAAEEEEAPPQKPLACAHSQSHSELGFGDDGKAREDADDEGRMMLPFAMRAWLLAGQERQM
jgi:hypothetical protein